MVISWIFMGFNGDFMDLVGFNGDLMDFSGI